MTRTTQEIMHHWRDAVPHDRLAHLIRDVSRAFTKSLTMQLEQHGVPFGYWTFLRVLWESDGLTQKQLSEKAGVMAPTTFVAMQSMQALGYVVRRQLPQNKKNVYIFLTPEGLALKKKLVPLAVKSNNLGIQGIPPADIKIVRQTLLAIIENIAREEQVQEAPPKSKTPVPARKNRRTVR